MATVGEGGRKLKWPALLLVLVTLLCLSWVIWLVDKAPRTDDAYAYADTIDVVPEVSGRIVTLAVRDNQLVRQGELLFAIDPRPFEETLTRTRASLVALDKEIELRQRTVKAQEYNARSVRAAVERARAAAAQARDTLRRIEPLLSPGYVSAEDVDRARTAQRATQAELTAAQLQAQQASAAVTGVDALTAQRAVIAAEIALAELQLEYTTVRAPFNGRVTALKISTGQYVSALKPVFTLIDTRRWYVVANFRETELRHILPGTPATVHLMADTARRFEGSVESVGYGVSPEEGGFVIGGLPRVERTLNWVHVSQRFPVKIRIGNPDPAMFRIGASAVAVLRPANR